jgi:hypothetical protein
MTIIGDYRYGNHRSQIGDGSLQKNRERDAKKGHGKDKILKPRKNSRLNRLYV